MHCLKLTCDCLREDSPVNWQAIVELHQPTRKDHEAKIRIVPKTYQETRLLLSNRQDYHLYLHN